MPSASGTSESRESWPQRVWWLAGLGAIAGLADHALLRDEPSVGQVALAAWVTVATVIACFTWRRTGWGWTLGFAVASGAVIAGVIYSPDLIGGRSDGGGWRLFCAGLAVAIAAPLFQAWRESGDWRLRYDIVHDHAWTNVVIWLAGWGFVGVVFALAGLLAGLFALIGIDALTRTLREPVVALPLAGAALGGAVGLLRERDRIVVGLQRVVLTVLAVLAPALAVGLLLFLASLPFTGLAPLWAATRATTPIVLSCVIAALVLANAVVGDGREPTAPAVLRAGAFGLGLASLPLALIALASVSSRIDQHGLTPDRLWALSFVGVATAYGVGYVAALAWPRRGWDRRLRGANLWLAVGLCGLTLLLATPLLDFGAWSARNQQTRLLSGAVPPEEFDWAAMAYDFGPAGRRALEQLAATAPSEVLRTQAADALAAVSRRELVERLAARTRRLSLAAITVVPEPVQPPPALLSQLRGQCGDQRRCVLYYTPDADVAVFAQGCETCPISVSLVRRTGETWGYEVTGCGLPTSGLPASRRTGGDLATGPVEIRSVDRRQLFVGGRPVGPAFE